MKNTESSKLSLTIGALVLFAALYVSIAWMAFQWRNPKSNEMSFWRHLPSVLMFEKLDEYQ